MRNDARPYAPQSPNVIRLTELPRRVLIWRTFWDKSGHPPFGKLPSALRLRVEDRAGGGVRILLSKSALTILRARRRENLPRGAEPRSAKDIGGEGVGLNGILEIFPAAVRPRQPPASPRFGGDARFGSRPRAAQESESPSAAITSAMTSDHLPACVCRNNRIVGYHTLSCRPSSHRQSGNAGSSTQTGLPSAPARWAAEVSTV